MPVNYEPVLSGLNEVRDLSLADEGRLSLDIPVLNSQPATNENIGIGKFLRCNPGTLIWNPNKFTADPQYYTYSMTAFETSTLLRVFDPAVEFILLRVSDWTDPAWFEWRNQDYSTTLKSYNGNGCYLIPFVGTDFYLRCRVASVGHFTWELFGFSGKDL